MADPLAGNEISLASSDASPSEIYRRLDSLARQRPELAEALDFYQSLLPILENPKVEMPDIRLDPDTVQLKFAQGVPLLAGEDLPFDSQAARSLFGRCCLLIETAPDRGLRARAWLARLKRRSKTDLTETEVREAAVESQPAAAARIHQVVDRGDLDLTSVWRAAAAGRWEEIGVTASALHLDPVILLMLAEISLIPMLRVWANKILKQVDLDDWRRRICPLCGSPPVLAEIQGKESAQRLRCGICGAGWYYPRLQCARCGNEDYRSLGIVSVEDEEEKYRLHTCHACRDFIKVVVTFEPTPVQLLIVEDLTTLHLDLIALERGFDGARVE